MRVTRNHPDQLVLQHKPAGLIFFNAAFLLCFTFVGAWLAVNDIIHGWYLIVPGLFIPGLILMGMVWNTRITFDRTSRSIFIRRLHSYGVRCQHYDLDEFRKASLEITHFGRNHSETFRCQLEMKDQDVVFLTTDLYAIRKQPQDIADIINTWLLGAEA